MKKILALTTTFIVATSAHAGALVELFTSSGCSSCPPADELLIELSRDPDVVALAFHVDYWDYLGAPDPFANPFFTSRQVLYQRNKGQKQVFTPQFMIDGQHSFSVTQANQIRAAIRQAAQDQTITAKTKLVNSKHEVTLVASRPLSGSYDVMLAYVMPPQTINIDAGENAGKTLTYGRVVDRIEALGTWNGQSPESYRIPVKAGYEAVLFVQEAGLGPVAFATNL